MTTKSLITIFHKGQYILGHSTYLSWHPDALGFSILLFLNTPGNITRLKSGLENTYISTRPLQEPTPPESPQQPQPSEAKEPQTPSYHTPFSNNSVSPNTGANILDVISKATIYDPLPVMPHSIQENDIGWTYVIDFDTSRFEVFAGNDEHAVNKSKEDLEREKYVGLQLLKGWDLGSLPNRKDKFLAAILENINNKAGDQ